MTTLLDFAKTDRQRQIVSMILEGKSQRAVARELGISRNAVVEPLKVVKRRAAAQGFSPDHDMTHICPDGYRVEGVSTFYDEDGNPKAQWVKTTEDQNRLREFADQLVHSIGQQVTPIRPKKAARLKRDADHMAAYIIGDAHIGMFAWAGNASGDWDCERIQSVLLSSLEEVMHASPHTETALIVNLGDWFHTDSLDNRTRRSGHQLDVDTRWDRVLDIGITLMRTIIDSALLKHERVHVINEIGNHDDHTSLMLSACIDGIYEQNDRVTVDRSAKPFHKHVFGNSLIGVNHGDKAKPEKLFQFMADEWTEDYAKCQWRYWYTGHIHHRMAVDISTQQIEAFRTVIERDSYAYGHGYRAPRSLHSIIHHKTHGEVARFTKGLVS